MVSQFKLFANERTVCFDDLLENGWIIQLFAVRQAIELQFVQFLLTSNQLEHAI